VCGLESKEGVVDVRNKESVEIREGSEDRGRTFD
jgi:hypothetical protein